MSATIIRRGNALKSLLPSGIPSERKMILKTTFLFPELTTIIHLQIERHLENIESFNFKIDTYGCLVILIKDAMAKSVNKEKIIMMSKQAKTVTN